MIEPRLVQWIEAGMAVMDERRRGDQGLCHSEWERGWDLNQVEVELMFNEAGPGRSSKKLDDEIWCRWTVVQ